MAFVTVLQKNAFSNLLIAMKQIIDVSEDEILLSNIKSIANKDRIDSFVIVKITNVFLIRQFIIKKLKEIWKIGLALMFRTQLISQQHHAT